MRLNRGQFLGEDVAGLSAGPLVLRVTRYAPGAELKEHDHPRPNLCLIVRGGFEDLAVGWGRASVGAAVMHPGGMGHAQRFADAGQGGGRSGGEVGSLALNIEMDRAWLHDVGGSDAPGLMRVTGDESLAAARRLRLALAAREPETCIAATVARLVCGRGVDGPGSRTAAARGIARSRLGGSVQRIAADTGLNASHLGREFVKRVGCSPSQMLKWERVAMAAEMLRDTSLPLAVVAMRAGYCDQSHLCREMKRVMGRTPKETRFGLKAAQETSKTA